MQYTLEDETVLCDAFDELHGTIWRVFGTMARLCQGDRGLCCMKSKTMARRLDCSVRTVERSFSKLAALGLMSKSRRRFRWSERKLTDRGNLALEILNAGGPLRFFAGAVSGHLSVLNGEAQKTNLNFSPKEKSHQGASPCDPRRYRLPRRSRAHGMVLGVACWQTLAQWLTTARSCSWARCRMTHNTFALIADRIGKMPDYRRWVYRREQLGLEVCSSEDLVRRAAKDALLRKKPFNTIKAASRYTHAILKACLSEGRMPGVKPCLGR